MADEPKTTEPEEDAKPPAEAASNDAAPPAASDDTAPPADAASDDAAPPADAVSDDAAPPAASADEPPRKKKKKKRKKEPVEEGPNPIGPDGRERPAFVLAFPSDPELDRLVKAFELGNYAYVREHGPQLLAKSEDPAVRDAARELVRRIEPDPLIKILLGISVALLLVLALWAYKTHGN